MNGNIFDGSAEDYFRVIGSSDESEPEHGLTDDSDINDGEDKRDEGGWSNFDDLDDAESDGSESESDHWPVSSLPASLAAVQSVFVPQETAECSNEVAHTRVTLPRPASSVPACLVAVHPVFVPQEEGVARG